MCPQVHVELDRAAAAAEGGYRIRLVRLRGAAPTTKVDVLVGAPRERAAGEGAALQWPWSRDLSSAFATPAAAALPEEVAARQSTSDPPTAAPPGRT